MMSILLQLPLFQGLTLDHLLRVLEKVRPNFTHATDECFIKQGCHHDQMVYVLNGTVKREYKDKSGRFTFCEELEGPRLIEPDTMFGRVADYAASYHAVGHASMLCLDKKCLFSIFNHFDVVQLNILNLLSAQSQMQSDKVSCPISGIPIKDFYHLVWKHSLVPSGAKEIDCIRHVLAEMLGCSRRRLSDEIGQYEADGLLTTTYGGIIIPDLALFGAAVEKERRKKEE